MQRLDGGGIRVEAVLEALRALSILVEVVEIGPPAGAKSVTESPLNRVKRQFLPVPLRSKVERELPAHPVHGSAVSLVSASHRWAIQNHAWSWIDYPDLWSQYAANPTAGRRGLARLASNFQAAAWRRRERAEAAAANVVTTASWTDARELSATWLPTPVWSGSLPKRVRPPDRKVAGLLANFDYPPNRAALSRLRETWAPVLNRLGYEVVIGGYGSVGLGTDSVKSMGPVGKVDDFYAEIDLVLAPVESGGGMKVKVIEALSRGLPVLADRHAVDGLPPDIAAGVDLWDADLKHVRLGDPRLRLGQALDPFSVDWFNRTVQELWDR